MKKILAFPLFFFILFSLPAQTTSCGQVAPDEATIGEAWIGSGCQSAILKVLSRSVRTSNLENLIWNHDPSWDNCDADPVDGTFCNPDIFAQGCSNTNYCPDKYCEELDFLTEINASMIFNAFGPWGNLHFLKPGTSLWDAMQQIPKDINTKYDLFVHKNGEIGLRRPHIQAGIYENIDNETLLSTVPIPESVIQDFRDFDPDFAAVETYYSTLPNFNLDNIRGSGVTGEVETRFWDVTKIEARMWFYYLATSYIDNGYTSLHSGQIGQWGRIDKTWPNAPYLHTARLMKMVRAYAQRNDKTVLISTENIDWENSGLEGAFDPLFGGDPNYPGAQKMIFDFDNVAMRIREYNDQCNLCDGSTDNLPLEAYDEYGFSTECNSFPLRAFLDQCTIDRWRTVRGISPLGCYYETVPYVGAFDFGSYVENNTCEADPGTASNPSCGNGALFNCYSDMAWFAEALEEPCKSDWLSKTICVLSDRSNGYGNLMIPTTKRINNDRGYYFFSEEPQSVINVLKEAWEENQDNLGFTQDSECGDLIGYYYECEGEYIPQPHSEIFEKRYNYYTFNVADPDCISEYSWHIYGPNGWSPSSSGLTRMFYPPISGIYKISLKQDDLNLEGQVNTIEEYIYLEKYCCTVVDDGNPEDPRDGGRGRSANSNLEGFLLEAYPSPFNSSLQFKINLPKEGDIDVRLYNSFGQETEVFINQQKFSTGVYTVDFNVSHLPAGYYVLKAINTSDNKLISIPLVKGNNFLDLVD